MTPGPHKILLTENFAIRLRTHALRIIEQRIDDRRNGSRILLPQSYTSIISRLGYLDCKNKGLPCYKCNDFIEIGEWCISAGSSPYVIKRYYHIRCATKLNIYPKAKK